MKLQSLSRDYKLFTNLVVFGAILISFLVLLFSYKSFYLNSKLSSKSTASKIDQQLSESLNYIENIANFVGQKISYEKTLSKEVIAEILLSSQPKIDQKLQDIFTWTLFDFVNLKNQVVASSLHGALKEPILIDVKKRSWIKDSQSQPWKLLSSKVDRGIVSNEKIIPFGFGVTNQNGQHIGILSLGINVEKIRGKIESILSKKYETFVVIARDGSMLFASSNFDESQTDSLEQALRDSESEQGFFKVNGNNFYHQLNYHHQFKIVVGVNKKLFWREFWKDFLPKALNTIYLTVFFLILLYFFRAKLLKPVLELAQAAEDVSLGKLDSKIPESDIFEVNLLSNSINKVKEFLIQEASVKENLKKSKETAESENYNKTEFLSSTAHELKNMLAGVIGLGELLKFNLTQRGKVKEIVELQEIEDENVSWIVDIVRLGEESLTFVNDILDINQAQTGEFKIEESELVDLKDVVLRSIKLMKTRAMHEKKTITSNLDKYSKSNFVTSNLDPRRVKQVVVNIISNSIKYSSSGSEIKINLKILSSEETELVNKKIELEISKSTEITDSQKEILREKLEAKKAKKKNRIAIEIEDNGFGMDDEELFIASKKYGTIKSNLTKKIDSTGLGLSIVKYLVEAQVGVFEIASEKNKGTKVKIIF
jgi:signal transduction histidine kinase